MSFQVKWRLLAIYCGPQVGIGKGTGASDELAELTVPHAEVGLFLDSINAALHFRTMFSQIQSFSNLPAAFNWLFTSHERRDSRFLMREELIMQLLID